MTAPVTMKEIDAARAIANDALAYARSSRGWLDAGDAKAEAWMALADARAEVERLLVVWWAQGCREVPSAPSGGGFTPGTALKNGDVVMIDGAPAVISEAGSLGQHDALRRLDAMIDAGFFQLEPVRVEGGRG